MKKNVSIIIPAYNEEATIESVLQKIFDLPFVNQVIVINDASADRTADIVEAFDDNRLILINKKTNEGKTAAIKTGLEKVNQDIVIIQDADEEYDPEEIEFLCNPIWQNRADVVYGSRFLVRQASRVLYFYHYLANKSLTFFSNLFTNKNMTDVETCYKAFRTPLLKNMPISSSGFGFEIEVTAKICKTRARVYETPISYYGRTYEEGKKISYWDGMLAFWYILKYNLFPFGQTRIYINNANKFLVNKEYVVTAE